MTSSTAPTTMPQRIRLLIERGLTNRLLSVVRPRMADKTSWTKPPSLHRYGDCRLTAPASEARLRRCVRRPPEGGGERAGEGSARGGPAEGNAQPARPWRQAGGRRRPG